MRWSVTEAPRTYHALALIAARAILLFGLGMGLLGSTLPGGDLFGAGWRSVLLIALLLGGLDVGLVLGFGLLRVGRTQLRDLGWTFEHWGRDLVLGLLGFAAAAAILVGAHVFLGGASLADVGDQLMAWTLLQRVLFVCVAIFGAALVEETLFRGYLQPALAQQMGLPAAIIVQALLFDLMHLNFHPGSLIVKFLFGVLFGVLKGKDRSLLVPGVAHGLVWAVFGA